MQVSTRKKDIVKHEQVRTRDHLKTDRIYVFTYGS